MRKRKPEDRSFQIGERVILNEEHIAIGYLEEYLDVELYVSEYLKVEKCSGAEMYRLKTKDGKQLEFYVYDFEIFLC